MCALLLAATAGNGAQVCGARGGGDAAKQGVFLVLDITSVWMLACESPWERNLCIKAIRQVPSIDLPLKNPVKRF